MSANIATDCPFHAYKLIGQRKKATASNLMHQMLSSQELTAPIGGRDISMLRAGGANFSGRPVGLPPFLGSSAWHYG